MKRLVLASLKVDKKEQEMINYNTTFVDIHFQITLRYFLITGRQKVLGFSFLCPRHTRTYTKEGLFHPSLRRGPS